MKKIMLFILVIGVKVGLSQNNTWNGATDNDWHKACNWSAGTIPSASDNVYIPTASPYPVISGNAHCKTLNITSAAANALTIQSSASGNLCISSINTGPCVTVVLDNGGCVTTATCGTQVFTTTNLNAGTMVTSNAGQSQFNNAVVEKFCYNNVASNCNLYGGLYEWNEAMNYSASVNCDPCGAGGRQGQCPAGYHIPTDLEWSRFEFCVESTIAPIGATTLATFQTTLGWRGAGTGDKMKSSATDTPAWNGTNSSGFSGIGSSYRLGFDGSFAALTTLNIHTATEANASDSWQRFINTSRTRWERGFSPKLNGKSIRCLKN